MPNSTNESSPAIMADRRGLPIARPITGPDSDTNTGTNVTASAIAAVIQASDASGPVQIRNAGGTRNGSQGRKTTTSGETATAAGRARRQPSPATMRPAA